jgi:hypothetical protein
MATGAENEHTVSTGMENPTPDDAPEGEYIAVFTPIKFPALSRSGPPLFPGLIAASVCITSCIGRPVAAELISLRNPLEEIGGNSKTESLSAFQKNQPKMNQFRKKKHPPDNTCCKSVVKAKLQTQRVNAKTAGTSESNYSLH